MVLGCTHFPLLKEEILQVLPGVTLVDSGSAVARRVRSIVGEMTVQGSGASWAYCTRLDAKACTLRGPLSAYGLNELLAWLD